MAYAKTGEHNSWGFFPDALKMEIEGMEKGRRCKSAMLPSFLFWCVYCFWKKKKIEKW